MNVFDKLLYYVYCGLPRYRFSAFFLRTRYTGAPVGMFAGSLTIFMLDILLIAGRFYHFEISELADKYQLLLALFLIALPGAVLYYFYRNNRWQKITAYFASRNVIISASDRIIGIAIYLAPFILLVVLLYGRLQMHHS